MRLIGAAICLPLFAFAALAQDTAPLPPTVLVTSAYTRLIADEAVFLGQCEAVDKADIVARVNGVLEKKFASDGESVSRGQPLFGIESDHYEAEVEAQQASLATAEAELRLAQIELDRKEQLVQRGSAAVSELDIARANQMIAQARVAAARAALRQAKLNLSYTEVSAPFTGRLGISNFSVGELVGSGSEPLTTLVREQPIYVRFWLNEKQVLSVLERLGGNISQVTDEKAPPSITIELSNGSILEEKGKLVFIDNQVDPTTGSILLRAEFENTQGLLVNGAFVDVRISSHEPTLRLLVPQAAIQRDQRGEFVLVVNQQSTVERRYIETRGEFETDMVVVDGLQEGEAVVIEGLQRVRSGVPVEAIEASEGQE